MVSLRNHRFSLALVLLWRKPFSTLPPPVPIVCYLAFMKPALQKTGLTSLLVAVAVLSGCNLASTGNNVQGKRLFDQGQYAQAIDSFQTAVEHNPRNADAWYNLGATYYYVGKQQRNTAWLQQADQLFRQALAADPNHADSWRSLAALTVESGHADEAFKMIQSWRDTAPGSAEPVIELARMYSEAGNRTQANQLLVDALKIDPANARALKAMGKMREESGELQLALQNYVRFYQANNLQTDVAEKIAALQGTIRTTQAIPLQPGQTRLGQVNQHVPR